MSTPSIHHSFVNLKADGGDATVTRPVDWNNDHVIDDGAVPIAKLATVASPVFMGRATAGTGAWEALSAAAAAALIPAGSITLAQQATIATQRLEGRNTAGTGAVEAVTATQVLDWLSASTGALLTRGASTWAAAANVTVDSGDLQLAASQSPATPGTAGSIKVDARADLARSVLAYVDADGLIVPLQPHLARAKVGYWSPQPGSTALPPNIGMGGPSVQGTNTQRTPTTTSMATSLRRIGAVSAASAGSTAGWRSSIAFMWRGNAAKLGGFHCVQHFFISDAAFVAGGRLFCGVLAAVTAPTDVEPDTLVNAIGVGFNAADTTLQLYASGSSAQARAALVIGSGPNAGGAFPGNTTNVDVYELSLYCPPNGSSIFYSVLRENTGDLATGTISVSANLPSTSTLMTLSMWRSNGATATAVGIDMVGAYTATEH